jgi:Holliday junction resolvase RusA-like endonuclease
MPLSFEFSIQGPPVSQQTRRRDRVREWTRTVRQAAERSWGDEPAVDGPVMVSITYFFDSVDFDIDNIPKPILDALNGLVYVDDRQITDLICRKRRQSDDLVTAMDSPGFDDFLIAGITGADLLIVRVRDAPVSEVLV